MLEYQLELIFLSYKRKCEVLLSYISISITLKFQSLLYLLGEHLIKRQNSRLKSTALQGNHNLKTLWISHQLQNPAETLSQWDFDKQTIAVRLPLYSYNGINITMTAAWLLLLLFFNLLLIVPFY